MELVRELLVIILDGTLLHPVNVQLIMTGFGYKID